MPHPVQIAKDDDIDTLNGRIATVKLDKREENPSRIGGLNPFAPYLENGTLRFVNDLARTFIPKRLSSLQQTRWLEINETCPIYYLGGKFPELDKFALWISGLPGFYYSTLADLMLWSLRKWFSGPQRCCG